jgi:hypothetical protein
MVFSWRVESYVLGRWLSTEYRSASLRAMARRRLRCHGKGAWRWPSSTRIGRRHAQAELEARGFMVCQKLVELAGNRLGELAES